MIVKASQVTDATTVCSIACSDWQQAKNKISRYCPFVMGSTCHWWTAEFPSQMACNAQTFQYHSVFTYLSGPYLILTVLRKWFPTRSMSCVEETLATYPPVESPHKGPINVEIWLFFVATLNIMCTNINTMAVFGHRHELVGFPRYQ